jgi:hypothetical protein
MKRELIMKTKIAKKENKKKMPAPGRKMTKREARDFVFKTYGQTMELLARK